MKPPSPSSAHPTPASLLLAPSRKTTLRWLIPFLLVFLFMATLIWLPRQAQQMEASERLEQLIADSLWVEQAIRFQLSRDDESMRIIAREIITGRLRQDHFRSRLNALLRNNREFYRVTWFSADGKPVASTDDFRSPGTTCPNPRARPARARARGGGRCTARRRCRRASPSHR